MQLVVSASYDLVPKDNVFAHAFAALVVIAVASCAAWTQHAMRMLDRATNLRLALVEHAPLLGRTVVAAMRVEQSTK